MARIAGVDLPRDKRVEIGLTYIYGIGRTSADRILKEAGVNPISCRRLMFIAISLRRSPSTT